MKIFHKGIHGSRPISAMYVFFWIFLGIQIAISNRSLGEMPRELVELRGMAEAAALFFITYLVLLGELLRDRFRFSRHDLRGFMTVAPLFLLLFIAALAGIIKGNYSSEQTYFLGDMYRYFKFPFVVFISFVALLRSRDIEKDTYRLFYGCVAIAISVAFFDASYHLYHYGLDVRFWSMSLEFLPWVLILTTYLRVKRRMSGLAAALVITISLFVAVISQTRSIIILSLVSVLYYLYKNSSSHRLMVMGSAILSGTFIFVWLRDLSVTQAVVSRFEGTADIASLGTRIYELASVIEHFKETPLDLLLGTGVGSMLATWSKSLDFGFVFGDYHYLHFSFLEILYRGGVLGILMVVLFFGRYHFMARKSLPPLEKEILNLLVLFFLAFGMFFSIMFEQSLLFIALGAFLARIVKAPHGSEAQAGTTDLR